MAKYKVYFHHYQYSPGGTRGSEEVSAGSEQEAIDKVFKIWHDVDISSVRKIGGKKSKKVNPRTNGQKYSYRVEDLDGIEIGTYNMEHNAREVAQKHADKYHIQVRIKRVKR